MSSTLSPNSAKVSARFAAVLDFPSNATEDVTMMTLADLAAWTNCRLVRSWR